MSVNDDTKPRSPFKDQPPQTAPLPREQSPYPPVGYEPQRPPYAAPPPNTPAGPGCLVWGVLSLTILTFGLLIVALAGTAGWTAGQRVAQGNATATALDFIGRQFQLVETDVASRNEYIVAQRLGFLGSVTPGVPGVAELRSTATALYLTLQPTTAPTATPTPTLTATLTPTPTLEVTEAVAAGTPSPFDLEALLAEAQEQIDLGEYEDAVDTLDAIIRIDPDYQRPLVRALISDALNTRATQLYRSVDTLAEAIRLTDLVEQYGGTLADGLSYERLIASLYLDAIRAVGTQNHLTAIRSLGQLASYQTTYQGRNINELIYNEYMAYGRALAISGDHCQAAGQFQSALNYFNTGDAQSSLQTSQTLCQLGTPTPDPLAVPTPGS